MLENLISTAERRALINKEKKTTLRVSDFMGTIPAITGKVELVYEGEQEGAAFVAEELIGAAIKEAFSTRFPKIEKLSKQSEIGPYTSIMETVFAEGGVVLYDESDSTEYAETLNNIEPLEFLLNRYQPDFPQTDKLFLKELVLWALVEYQKLGKERLKNGFQFIDLF